MIRTSLSLCRRGVCKKNLLFGICNPMVDITVDVDVEYLTRYMLKPGQSTVADERNIDIFEDIQKNKSPIFTLGGATLNVFRCFSWMLKEDHGDYMSTFVGAVGKNEEGETDDIGNFIKEQVENDGVDGRWEERTGLSASCAVLIVKDENKKVDRTLVANLGVSDSYSTEHFLTPEIQSLVETAEMYYFSGFFAATNSEVLKLVADHSFESCKTFGLNLSAEFVIREYFDEISSLIFEGKVDYLFGNDEEACYFAEEMGWPSCEGGPKKGSGCTIETAKRIIERIGLPDKYVIFTQGYEPIIAVYMDGETGEIIEKQFPVANPDLNVVDTNGAGDSFVGGFLSQIAQGRDIDTACLAGKYSSSQIIQMSGVDFFYH